jgi:hypothetical protein
LRYVIAAIALVVILAGVAFSKRKTGGIDDAPVEPSAAETVAAET